MSTAKAFPHYRTLEVRDTCLCLHAQRAARALARRFDEVFRPLNVTNGQFSLLMSLNRPSPPTMSEVVPLLGMDRTSLTAMLKPLERRGLVEIKPDKGDRRKHRLLLTSEGHAILAKAYPLWRNAHADIESGVEDPGQLRTGLMALAK